MPEQKKNVDVNGFKVSISNLDKVLFPDAKIIKAQLIQYFIEISPYLLKFGEHRPLSLIRFPDGIKAHQFYSKNIPEWAPEWLVTQKVADDEIDYLILKATQDLVWLANIAAIEIHAMNKRVSSNILMDHIIFDLDPPEDFSYEDLRELTIQIGEFLKSKSLIPFVKTSGSRGAHIYIPIDPTDKHDEVILEIKRLANEITSIFPEQTTNYFNKLRRKGKILIDINRNFKSQTTILPFSTRAKSGAPVSLPLTWADFHKTNSSQDFTIFNALEYVQNNGYAWESFDQSSVNILEYNTLKVRKIVVDNKVEKVASDDKEKLIIPLPNWFSNPKYKHMLAGVSENLIEGENYVYENKWDGIRVFVYLFNGICKIISRGGRDITNLFPEIEEQGKFSKVSCVLDGELVVFDEKGRPEFSRIISRMHSKGNIEKQLKQNPTSLFIFDVIRNGDVEIMHQSWEVRRGILKDLLKSISGFRLSEAVKEGDLLYKAALSMDLEGIMIKDKFGIYQMEKRTNTWLKLKFRLDADCVIVGYTKGEGDRSDYFGSLHVAEVDEEQLIYRGRVGTGFDGEKLSFLKKIFDTIPNGEKYIRQKVEEEKNSIWFSKLFPFCKIQYARLSSNGSFREPVYKGLTESFYEI